MDTELRYLALAATLTALIWIPYVLERIKTWGLVDAVGYPASPKPQAPWAVRMMAAHANAVENLVVFGVLVLVAHAAGIHTGATAFAAALYFWARVVHLAAYTFAVPWVRTLGFFGGFVAQMIFAAQLL